MSYLKKTNRSCYPSGYSVIYWVIYFELYFWVYIFSYIFQNINLLSENKLKKDLTRIIIMPKVFQVKRTKNKGNKMKTQVKITNDDYGQTAYDNYIEDINYLVNEQNNVFCEIKNNRFTNIVEDEKNYSSSPDDYRNKTIIEAKGYTQGEWQEYVIYHNKPIQALKKQLKRSFTHFNGYCVEKSKPYIKFLLL